ncbi:MAG: hypothetical protein ACI8Z5_002548, partial [Lentimonas sp.]
MVVLKALSPSIDEAPGMLKRIAIFGAGLSGQAARRLAL